MRAVPGRVPSSVAVAFTLALAPGLALPAHAAQPAGAQPAPSAAQPAPTTPPPSAAPAPGAAPAGQPAPVLQPPPGAVDSEARADSAVIGFDEAVRQTLARNPSAVVAFEEIRRAQALLEQTRSSSLPTITVNGLYTALDHDRTQTSAGVTRVISGANQFNASITLAVPLVATQRWVQWGHAKDNVEIARLGTAEVRRQLALGVGRTYLSLVAQHRVIEATERALANARAHYDFAHKRFAGGYGTRVDEVRAAEEVSTDQAQVEQSYAALTRLREALGVLLGVDHAVDAADDFTLPTPPDLAAAERDAPKLRSDVRLFSERLRAASRVSRDSWTDYMPTIVGSFSPFYQTPPTLTVPETGWQAQIGLAWSLYDGGLRYGQAHERRALENQARAQLEGGARQAQSDVRAAAVEVERAERALSAAREAARLANQSLELTNIGYRAGASTNIEVIDAERRARDADTTAVQAEDAARQARLDLLIASGRFPS